MRFQRGLHGDDHDYQRDHCGIGNDIYRCQPDDTHGHADDGQPFKHQYAGLGIALYKLGDW